MPTDPAPGAAAAARLNDETLALAFKALAHPARLAILRALGAREKACCGEIVECLPLAQSTVSQHLQILREAGIIRGESEGRKSCYCIDGEMIAALGAASSHLLSDLAMMAERCRPAPQGMPAINDIPEIAE